MPMKRTVPCEKSAVQGSRPADFSLGWTAFMTPAIANMAPSTACTTHKKTFTHGFLGGEGRDGVGACPSP